MQVKKYEAPTLQEALDTIKRELGPEAIILQTKHNRRGFGLMSKGSVEVTAAVSERAIDKKKSVEKRLPDAYTQKIKSLPAKNQADLYESYLEKRIERDQVQLSQSGSSTSSSVASKKITAVRYADIQDDSQSRASTFESTQFNHSSPAETSSNSGLSSEESTVPTYTAPFVVQEAVDQYSQTRSDHLSLIQSELSQLKRLVEELRRERKRPEYIDSDSPLAATEALQEAFEMILHSGVERRFAIQMMREVFRNLTLEARADREAVLDAVAEQVLRTTMTKPIFGPIAQAASPEVHAFIGPHGSGKTSALARLATDAARNKNEKVGIIRIQLLGEETVDPLVVFAKAIHTPYRAVTSAEELQVAVQDMSVCHRILIDTPGISFKDSGALSRLKSIFECVPQIKVQLVLSAITRDLELHEQSKVFKGFNPESILFTRLDEAYSPGVVYSISARLGIPVSVFLRGKKVTEDWELASPERIAASILNIVC